MTDTVDEARAALLAIRERVQRFETGRNDESDTFYRAATDRTYLLGRLDDERALRAALIRSHDDEGPDAAPAFGEEYEG